MKKHPIWNISPPLPLRYLLQDKHVQVKTDVFARCQVVLMTSGLSECRLLFWQLNCIKCFTVKRDDGWCGMMLRVLAQIYEQFVKLQKVPNFDGLQGYDDLLLATKEGCAAADITVREVPSIRGNAGDKLFA